MLRSLADEICKSLDLKRSKYFHLSNEVEKYDLKSVSTYHLSKSLVINNKGNAIILNN